MEMDAPAAGSSLANLSASGAALGRQTSSGVKLQFNCIYRTIVGEVRVPSDTASGPISFSVYLNERSGRRKIDTINLLVDPAAPEKPDLKIEVGQPQYTANELMLKLPELPVAVAGDGFVIFDLRRWRAQSSAPNN
jgi:hypothetical protein